MTTTTASRSRFSLRKDDLVQVIAGRDKGKTGKVIKIHPAANRITVEKINMVKRHTKPTQGNPGGGIVEKETPVHYSNVLLMCGKCNRGVRHGFKVVEKKTKTGTKTEKTRVCKKCNGTFEAATK
jgi:large subunit ribosomal protein L24